MKNHLVSGKQKDRSSENRIMDLVGSFPFGWIRNFKDENWQIIWDSKSKALILKSSLSENIIEYCSCADWKEAKMHADEIRSNHQLLNDII